MYSKKPIWGFKAKSVRVTKSGRLEFVNRHDPPSTKAVVKKLLKKKLRQRNWSELKGFE